MSRVLENIEPKSVLKFFEEISAIPRGSKNEQEISDYLVKFGKDRGFETIQDEHLNVIIKKPAKKGYEHVPSMIIQGHMDMVCEKNQGTVHDFEKDGLKLRVEDGWLKATGTTLGADNGIAVAFALALLDSENIGHPELEVLITADEEMGMTGAIALDPKLLKSKTLINIDTEEEGELYVSCAGGARGVFGVPVNFEEEKVEGLHISIRGLQGGHSGCDAHEQRANSNKLLGRVLDRIRTEEDIKLASISGGSKDNAIPREADAVVVGGNFEKIAKIVDEFNAIFGEEFRVSDKDVKVGVERVEVTKVMDKESSEKIISTLVLHPSGVKTISLDIEGLVESSLNLGVIITEENRVVYRSAIRSSVASRKAEIINELHAMAKLTNCTFDDGAHYPAWSYRAESKIRDTFEAVYEKINGKKPGIKAIHAGLECGLFDEKFDDIDMISFGPDIRGAHTPEERVNIKSVENVWKYFVAVMEDTKNFY